MTSNPNNLRLVGAVGVLAGGIIGAGVFSLPYIARETGLLVGAALLLLATVAYSITHLMYADVMTGTAGEHRFVGYIKKHLGSKASYLALLMAVVQMIFVLTIYLILSISFIRLIFPTLPPTIAIGIFWVISSATIFMKLKKMAILEMAATGGIIAIIALLFCVGIPHLGALAHASETGSFSLLMPLAVIFFALSGRVAIPPLVQYLRQGRGGSVPRHLLRASIISGTAVPAVVYALFVIAVLAISPVVSQEAVTGLAQALPHWFMVLVGILGLLALWSSYILAGLDVYDTLRYDFDVPRWLQLFLVIGAPIVLYIAGFTSFIGLVSFVGGIFLALEGILITLLWRAAQARSALGGLISMPSWVLVFLWVFFGAALIGVVAGGYGGV